MDQVQSKPGDEEPAPDDTPVTEEPESPIAIETPEEPGDPDGQPV